MDDGIWIMKHEKIETIRTQNVGEFTFYTYFFPFNSVNNSIYLQSKI